MSLITGRTSLAASSQSANVLEGSSYEFLQSDSIVVMDAIVVGGTTVETSIDVQCLFQIGGVTLMQPPFSRIFNSIDAKEGPGMIPNSLYHNYIRSQAVSGSRLFLSFLNAETSAHVVNWIVRID